MPVDKSPWRKCPVSYLMWALFALVLLVFLPLWGRLGELSDRLRVVETHCEWIREALKAGPIVADFRQ